MAGRCGAGAGWNAGAAGRAIAGGAGRATAAGAAGRAIAGAAGRAIAAGAAGRAAAAAGAGPRPGCCADAPMLPAMRKRPTREAANGSAKPIRSGSMVVSSLYTRLHASLTRERGKRSMHQRRAMIIARSQDRLAPRSSTPRSADGWVLPPQWETADDRAIDRPALGGDGLSINADPHDTVLVRHDGRNNVIGILKPRRMGPGCDWSATPFLQSLAQLCAGFACFTMEPRPFAIRSTRSLQQPRTSAARWAERSEPTLAVCAKTICAKLVGTARSAPLPTLR